jgi:hypothetical protein
MSRVQRKLDLYDDIAQAFTRLPPTAAREEFLQGAAWARKVLAREVAKAIQKQDADFDSDSFIATCDEGPP